MGLKKTELYRGFNIFTEEVRAGGWRAALVEVPAADGGERSRTPEQGRLPGEHPSQAAALTAARAHIDRIHQNRRSRSGWQASRLAGWKTILIPRPIQPS